MTILMNFVKVELSINLLCNYIKLDTVLVLDYLYISV